MTHTNRPRKDYGKSFRSRPGSADWRAGCSCGWQSSGYYYGRSEAEKAFTRHLMTFGRAER